MYTFDGKAYNCPFDCFIDIIKGKSPAQLAMLEKDPVVINAWDEDY